MHRGFLLLCFLLGLLVFKSNAQYNRDPGGPLKYKVFFDTSDFNLDERDQRILQQVAEIIKQKPGILFEVSGHTDTLGTEAFNKNLSLQRANRVKDYLLSQGVSQKNLYVVGKGEGKPLVHMGKYDAKFSRRVEFKQILRVSGMLVDGKTGRGVSGKVLINVPHKPMMNEEFIVGKDGKFEFITAYRPKYYFFGFAEGYLTATDSIMATMEEPGSSNVDLRVRMTQAVITEKINFDNIYFYEAKHKVMPKSEESIQKIVDLMTEKPSIYVEIRGHVNQPNRESLPKNVIEDGYKLSFARAEAVYNELVRKGISPSRIKYRGMGSDEMKYPVPETPAQNEANRRVEIVILNVR